jgi:hypothetical protein
MTAVSETVGEGSGSVVAVFSAFIFGVVMFAVPEGAAAHIYINSLYIKSKMLLNIFLIPAPEPA